MLTDSLSNRDTVSAPAQDCHKTLFISVIVPVRNEAKFIEHTLAQLTGRDYDRSAREQIGLPAHAFDLRTHNTSLQVFSCRQS